MGIHGNAMVFQSGQVILYGKKMLQDRKKNYGD